VPSRASGALVTTSRQLRAEGVSRAQLDTELRAGRWQRAGLAIVLHNGPLSPAQRRRVAQIHGGPQAIFTAFTGAEILGLQGWERDRVHLAVPHGTRPRVASPVPIALHRIRAPVMHHAGYGDVEHLPDALLRAAATFATPRPGCGLLAAAVQQRLVPAADLAAALQRASRTRHRTSLRLAVADIAGGSEALSEIDFVRLCRRNRLPMPIRQLRRRERSGRWRYLDATWRRRDGRLVVAEVDGALHLAPRRWWDDQLRQNELALTDALVLRFPSVVVRAEEPLVVGQLRRALWL
jgi:very-short-patch-repair endonuclease